MKDPRIERILVPVDFSEITDAVIEHACYLARSFDAEMALLHVVHVPPLAEASTWLDPVISPSVEQDLRKQMKAGAEEKLKQMARECGGSGKEPEVIIREGIPFDEIIKLASERHMELIVMGTHGHTGLTHLIIGSVAERVVRRAPCSVFCINPRAAGDEY